MSTMTLEEVRDWHKGEHWKLCAQSHSPSMKHKQMADAIDAHLAQPAQAVDVELARKLIAIVKKQCGGYTSGPGSEALTAADALDRALSGEKAGPADGWKGLADGEKAQFVQAICGYGTEFVTPLFSVIGSVERALRDRNVASPTPEGDTP